MRRTPPRRVSASVPRGGRVAGRHDKDHLVAEERLEDDTTVTRGGADDPKLELPLGHLLDDAVRVRNRECDAQLGVLTLKLAQQNRDDGAAGPGRRAKRKLAAQLTVFARELFEQLSFESEHPL